MRRRGITLGVELTGHCDLRCRHCLRSDLSTVVELDPELFARVVDDSAVFGVPHFAFTGGEVTLHRRFLRFFEIVAAAGRTCHFVTNGNSYPTLRARLVEFRRSITGISMSLEGATAEVHDRIRGRGSFRRTLLAIALASSDGFFVTVQIVVNRHNRHQLRDWAELCASFGAGQLLISHTQPVDRASRNRLPLDPAEMREVDREVEALRDQIKLPIGSTSGYVDPVPLAHCQTLRHEAFNIDCHGRLTFCCQLSGVAGAPAGLDVIADLREVPFLEAIERHLDLAHTITKERLRYVAEAKDDPYRDLHCHYCLKRFGKLAHLGIAPEEPVAGPSAGAGSQRRLPIAASG